MADDKQITVTLTDHQYNEFMKVLKPYETPESELKAFIERVVRKRGGQWREHGANWQTPDDNAYTRHQDSE